eukprot:490903-Rhodomonas_salina.1
MEGGPGAQDIPCIVVTDASLMASSVFLLNMPLFPAVYPGSSRDLHVYSPVLRVWYDLSSPSSGSAPTARIYPAMAASGSVIYVFGGEDVTGE